MDRDAVDQGLDNDRLPDAAEPQEQINEVKRAVPAWLISFVVHLVVLGLLSLIVYAAKEQVEDPAVRTVQLSPPVDPVDPSIKPIDPTSELFLDVEVTVDKPSPITELDTPVENFSSEEEDEAAVPKGREEAKADSEMGGQGAFMAIGAGSSASGMFGSRVGGGKKRALNKFGGNGGTEAAVNAALRWLKKHQSPNGQWDVDGYQLNCGENPKCEPGTSHTDDSGDIAMTGYAVRCFLGAGYDSRMPSRYRTTVKKAIEWLVSIQKADGLMGTRNYEMGIAAMALTEAYAMSNDPALKGPAQLAIDKILSRQAQDKAGGYGLGWDYTEANPERMDASISGWCVMALKSGAAAGLNVGNGMQGAKRYLERAWKATNKDFKASDPYTDVSTFPYTWNSLTDAVVVADKPNTIDHDMVAVGALCAVFLGHKSDDVMLNSMANYIMKFHLPQLSSYPCNLYYLYYETMAIFQVGGERWEKWNKICSEMLVKAQRRDDGCFDGSWDATGTEPRIEGVGRLFSTVLSCLSLEVYYIYTPVGQAAL